MSIQYSRVLAHAVESVTRIFPVFGGRRISVRVADAHPWFDHLFGTIEFPSLSRDPFILAEFGLSTSLFPEFTVCDQDPEVIVSLQPFPILDENSADDLSPASSAGTLRLTNWFGRLVSMSIVLQGGQVYLRHDSLPRIDGVSTMIEVDALAFYSDLHRSGGIEPITPSIVQFTGPIDSMSAWTGGLVARAGFGTQSGVALLVSLLSQYRLVGLSPSGKLETFDEMIASGEPLPEAIDRVLQVLLVRVGTEVLLIMDFDGTSAWTESVKVGRHWMAGAPALVDAIELDVNTMVALGGSLRPSEFIGSTLSDCWRNSAVDEAST
jgi:hypothetical protein